MNGPGGSRRRLGRAEAPDEEVDSPVEVRPRGAPGRTQLRAPGREPGGTVVWEAATSSLFTSDMLYDGEHGPAWPPENPTAYAATLERMRNLRVPRVYPGRLRLTEGVTCNATKRPADAVFPNFPDRSVQVTQHAGSRKSGRAD